MSRVGSSVADTATAAAKRRRIRKQEKVRIDVFFDDDKEEGDEGSWESTNGVTSRRCSIMRNVAGRRRDVSRPLMTPGTSTNSPLEVLVYKSNVIRGVADTIKKYSTAEGIKFGTSTNYTVYGIKFGSSTSYTG